MRRLSLLLAAALTLSGCASVTSPGASMPDPAPPSGFAAQTASRVEVPASWLEIPARPPLSVGDDAILADLLVRAGDTPDIDAANARLAEAQALLSAARAVLLPSITGTASADASDNDNGSGSSRTVGLSATIPVDLVGASRSRAGAQAARAQAAAFETDRVKLLSRRTAGQLYAAYRTAREQVALTRRSLVSAEDSLSLASIRQQAGLESGLGVAQAMSSRDAIAARLPNLEHAATAARLGLEALIGGQPGSLIATLQADAPIPWPRLEGQAPLPQVWIVQRPDLRASAARLEASGLDARAAQRDRLPSLSISAFAGQVSGDAILTGGSSSVSAALVSTLFDFGRLRSLASAAGARAQADAASYEKAVVSALAEVETEASRVRQADAAVQAELAGVASSTDQLRLARVRYTSGLTSVVDVLLAERALLDAENARAVAAGERADAAFAYAAALGL
jgi:outer membrane protein, multidrug efflux system